VPSEIESCSSGRGALDLLSSGTAIKDVLMPWESHSSHTEPSVFGVLVSVGDYEVSPTPPITVTHKPEEDTFGVSPVLCSVELFCMHFLLLMIWYLHSCAVLRSLQGKSLPLSLKATIRRILWLVLDK